MFCIVVTVSAPDICFVRENQGNTADFAVISSVNILVSCFYT